MQQFIFSTPLNTCILLYLAFGSANIDDGLTSLPHWLKQCTYTGVNIVVFYILYYCVGHLLRRCVHFCTRHL